MNAEQQIENLRLMKRLVVSNAESDVQKYGEWQADYGLEINRIDADIERIAASIPEEGRGDELDITESILQGRGVTMSGKKPTPTPQASTGEVRLPDEERMMRMNNEIQADDHVDDRTMVYAAFDKYAAAVRELNPAPQASTEKWCPKCGATNVHSPQCDFHGQLVLSDSPPPASTVECKRCRGEADYLARQGGTLYKTKEDYYREVINTHDHSSRPGRRVTDDELSNIEVEHPEWSDFQRLQYVRDVYEGRKG